ncbi:FAD-dependent oxidoreductase [[Clostridium] hylemonae]|uniref:FAD-dependent oxidoreductase n=1 Tax=[Clostridium] hylemonae TaxID=89153 RepID=UPI001FCC0157|nr:FAD-dependent oxidoreductase [[Clostridium] hylemonae]BDF04708.1 flavocytochrome c [[Clostridium] hylemonae]
MANYVPGTYEGIGHGYQGRLIVNVTVTEDEITEVKIIKHKEVRGLAWDLPTSPVEVMPPQIVKYQSLNIPLVNGADLTSGAILEAVEGALRAAGAANDVIEKLKAAPGPEAPEAKDEVRTVDVAVFGAGAGGLAAAIEAKEGGADVVLIEKQGITGGSTARSGGKLLGAGTKWQKKQGIYDTEEMCYNYLMEVGNRRGNFMDASKNRYLVKNLNSTLDWLGTMGYKVQDVEAIHVSMQPWRVHNSMGGGGQTNGQGGEITTPLTHHFAGRLGGEIIYNTALKELLTDENGVVNGAVCEKLDGSKLTVYAKKGVILATGGYSRNKEMCARYPVAHYFCTAPKSNVGEGLVAAEKIGARNFVHPGIQVVYTSLSCGIGINDESGLIVNERGERVVNEWSYQYHVSDALAASGSNCGWYITSGDEPYGGVQYGFKQAVEGTSRDKAADSIEELAALIKCDPATLRATFDRYQELTARGEDEDFGKPARFLHPIDGPKYAALRLHPCVTVSFGGLETDISARVLDNEGRPIPGLYAAGEVADTGMFGTEYPTCGTSIGGALFYGRIAGRMASGQSML